MDFEVEETSLPEFEELDPDRHKSIPAEGFKFKPDTDQFLEEKPDLEFEGDIQFETPDMGEVFSTDMFDVDSLKSRQSIIDSTDTSGHDIDLNQDDLDTLDLDTLDLGW